MEFYVPQFFVAADGVTPLGNYAPLGWKGMALYNNAQENFVEEIRLQSKNDAAALTWVAGAFFSHNTQSASEPISTNFLHEFALGGVLSHGLRLSATTE